MSYAVRTAYVRLSYAFLSYVVQRTTKMPKFRTSAKLRTNIRTPSVRNVYVYVRRPTTLNRQGGHGERAAWVAKVLCQHIAT